jgi:hypothetical protein
MKNILFVLFLLNVHFTSGQMTVSNIIFTISFDRKGNFSEITDLKTGINYLYKDTLAPLLVLISNEKRFFPGEMKYDRSTNTIKLNFKELKFTALIRVKSAPSHIRFDLLNSDKNNLIDGIVWGPIPTTISKSIGEVIGVVRDEKIAMGIQVMNIKTLGGDYNPEGQSWNRGDAAMKKPWGSILQAFSINRDKFRYVDTWGGEYKRTPVEPIKGETVAGSSISIFMCSESETLDYIEKIELAEGLPHLTINGEWVKKAIKRGRSYMISDFKESEIDEMIGYTKRSGLISLYHEGPFKSWGHYVLDTSYFPGGKEGIKKCATKTRNAGLYFGVHTLTNFINTNDPYVTPVPDDRLVITGYGYLSSDIDTKATVIPVSTNEYFNKQQGNNLHTLKIGKELIKYRSVTDASPFMLLDCQRGAFGTVISSHSKNDKIGKLYDHPYEVFFPNFEMQREIAKNLALFFNETGINHLDFDGHEGCLASGQGDYAINLFAKDFYDNLDHEVLNGTSLSKTFYWHINTFCNWGEPWYGGFRESMQEYRIANQELFDRNFIPHMLGWYLLTKNTSLGEMEWMLARAAGFDAGFAMVGRVNSIRQNPIAGQLLDAIREWEKARLSEAFSEDQKTRMKNPSNEFHLEKIGDNAWNLHELKKIATISHENIMRQPGEPVLSTKVFSNNSFDQPLQFSAHISGISGSIKNVKIKIDNFTEILIDKELSPGESLTLEGNNEIRIFDIKGKLKEKIHVNNPALSAGGHQISISAQFSRDDSPKIEIIVKAFDNPEMITSAK